MMEKIPVVAVVGPTASGKTALAVEVAKALDGEVVSADSMQIYRRMDIATAKPTVDEMQGVPHYLLDFLDPGESFSVARYCELAKAAIQDIHSRGKLPVIAGGTGLYVDSLLGNTQFTESDPDPALRDAIIKELEEKGIDQMLDHIRTFDPESAERLSIERNPKRIVRCIEVYRTTGIHQTQINIEQQSGGSPYRCVKIGLTARDREFLYDRINRRVDIMLDHGLLEETKAFYQSDVSDTASAAIGYKELLPFLHSEQPLDICVANLKRATRRYAKRQLTWFKRDEEIHWFNIDEKSFDQIKSEALAIIKGSLL